MASYLNLTCLNPFSSTTANVSTQDVKPVNYHDSLEHLEMMGAAITNESVGLLEQFQKLSKLLIANCFGITEKGRQALTHSQALKDRLVAFGLGLFALSKDMAVEIIKDFKVLKNLSLYSSEPIPKMEDELEKLASQRSPEVDITFRWGSLDDVFFDIHINFGYPFWDTYLLWQ